VEAQTGKRKKRILILLGIHILTRIDGSRKFELKIIRTNNKKRERLLWFMSQRYN
jgi:hypothetical protein